MQRLIQRALILFALAWPLVAGAQATVQFLSGTLAVTRADGTVRLLSEKSEIRVGDVISTEKNSFAQIKFTDGGQMTLRPDTQVKLDQYEFEEKVATGKETTALSLIKGGLRKITGLIGSRNRDGFKLRTETATVGIRGTDFVALVIPPGGSLQAGTYVTVTQGAVAVLSAGAEALVGAGQTGFAPGNLPPRIIPPPANLPTIPNTPAGGSGGGVGTTTIASAGKVENCP